MRRGRRILVVGAGLTGASLAWLGSDRGDDVTVISHDRPASQTTALAPGLVHGVGLLGGFRAWSDLDEAEGRRAARRDQQGYALLRDLVLASRRQTGFLRCAHLLLADAGVLESEVTRAAAHLREFGFPVECREHAGALALCREDDALVHPRRLTFEMLRRATEQGAELRLGVACRALDQQRPGGPVKAFTTDGDLEADLVYWAAGRVIPGRDEPSRVGTRIVLHQTLAPGREPLEWMLEGPEGDLLLAPVPDRPGYTMLSRMAEETVAGGLQWPEPPPAWDVYRGPAVRHRISETMIGSPGMPLDRRDSVRALIGSSAWPVAMLLGACAEALGLSVDATPELI